MKRYRFIVESVLPERLVRDPVVLELVSKMEPDDIVAALSKLGLQPSDAAQAAGALMRHANDAMAMPYHTSKDDKADPDNDLKKLATKPAMQPGKGKLETFGMGAADAPISTFLFPDEEEEPEDWPYDSATTGIMNAPLALGPRMST
jgi:hypothetical protein